MIGFYKLIDDSIYEIFMGVKIEERKRSNVLMAKCLESKTKSQEPFIVQEENIRRNVLFGSWVKIENYKTE